MSERVSPARAVYGAISIPGDKSISHRYAMLTSIAQGTSKIYNYSSGGDCRSTLECMQALGIRHEFSSEDGQNVLTVHGQGMYGLSAPERALEAGNSGSTMRMLSGILAAQPFTSSISGDESLVKRPMKRVISPLSEMGARIEATGDGYPPLTIYGSKLKPIEYTLPVASAQVKSCILLAGLYAEGETVIREPVATRDHTELALRELGADVTLEPRTVRLSGRAMLNAQTLLVPGDLSSAAFFIVAALLLPDSNLIVTGVGLNPTRTALLDVLRSMGASIKVLRIEQINGELLGNLEIKSSRLTGGTIEGATTAALIDEIPILAILGAKSEQGLTVKDAAELRVKETDRIETIAQNLRAMGVEIRTAEDGFHIPGKQRFRAGEVDSCGDHRIAMAFSIAALLADGETVISGAEAAAVSFPEFYTHLRSIVK